MLKHLFEARNSYFVLISFQDARAQFFGHADLGLDDVWIVLHFADVGHHGAIVIILRLESLVVRTGSPVFLRSLLLVPHQSIAIDDYAVVFLKLSNFLERALLESQLTVAEVLKRLVRHGRLALLELVGLDDHGLVLGDIMLLYELGRTLMSPGSIVGGWLVDLGQRRLLG